MTGDKDSQILQYIKRKLPYPFIDVWFSQNNNLIYDFHEEEFEKRVSEIKTNFDDIATSGQIFRLLFTYQKNKTSGLQTIASSINELANSYYSRINLQAVLPSGIEGLSYVDPNNPNLRNLHTATNVIMLLASSNQYRKAEPLLNDLIQKHRFLEDSDICFTRSYIYLKRAEEYIFNFFDVQYSEIERVSNSEHLKSYNYVFSLKKHVSNFNKNHIPALHQQCLSLINKAISLDKSKYEYYHFRYLIESQFNYYLQLTGSEKIKDDQHGSKILISDSMLNDLKTAALIESTPDNWYSYYNILITKILNDNDILFISTDANKKRQIKQSDIIKIQDAISKIKKICASKADTHCLSRMYNLLSFYHLMLGDYEPSLLYLSKSVSAYNGDRTVWDNLFMLSRSNGTVDLFAPLSGRYRTRFHDDKSFFVELLTLELSGQTDKVKSYFAKKPSFEYDNSNDIIILMEVFILIRRIEQINSKKIIDRCKYLLSKYKQTSDNSYTFDLYNAVLHFLEKKSIDEIIKIGNKFPEETFCENLLSFLKASNS